MKVSRTMPGADSDAHKFDQFLKKLETTKKKIRDRADSSDNSTFDSRLNESAFNDTVTGYGCDNNDDDNDDDEGDDQPIFETRQSFVDRVSESNQHRQMDSPVDSFIERAQSGGGGTSLSCNRDGNMDITRFFDEGLPDAILKLDRRQAIPTPRHNNDVLVEIEASTVDRREFMTRPGVRCTETLPQGVDTIGMDCIGRVVQLTTHARAIYGISIDDRVAAIYPFEYKDGCKYKGRRNNRYALVDAGLVVTVPKHVDAAEASCMIRLYLSAFQSIQIGMSSLHDRYDISQLRGQSILVQNGETELGRALIELGLLLGASRIFATGPTESHPLLKELGAVPLGAETFGWELFIEEKLSMVLVQEMPTAETFEQFISILDDNKGNMVYIHHGNRDDDDDSFAIAEGITHVNCEGCTAMELARKAKEVMSSAKFSIRLACSPKYIQYEGVWPSCKENQIQFKEDLRFLLTLLGRGDVKPNVSECIGLEEVNGVQDRIELLGKKGTIVCLPTALYEKKVYVVNPQNSPCRDQLGFPVMDSDFSDDLIESYATDAGYVKAAAAHDTLSDFHSMRDAAKNTASSNSGTMTSLPALPESTTCSHSHVKNQSNFAGHNTHQMGSTSHARRMSDGMESTSLVSSIGYNSVNSSANNSVVSDGVLEMKFPNWEEEEDPPNSIQFRNKQSRRYRAFQRQKRAKETRKRTQQLKETKSQSGKQDDIDSQASQEHSVSSASLSPSFAARQLRRQARLRGQRAQGDQSVGTSTSESRAMQNSPSGEKSGRSSNNMVEQRGEVKPVPAYINTAKVKRSGISNASSSAPPSDEEVVSVQNETVQSLNSMQTPVSGKKMNKLSRVLSDDGIMPDANIELQDSRHEDECSRDDASNSQAFNSLMKKWQSIDNKNHR